MQTVRIWEEEHKFVKSLLYAGSCELSFVDITIFHATVLGAELYYAILQTDKLKFAKGNKRVTLCRVSKYVSRAFLMLGTGFPG